MDINNKRYNNPEIVNKYTKLTDLSNAETTILNEMKTVLRNSSLLDIGCGAGRTTIHFAPECKNYTGIDYAESMIEYCKKTFISPNTDFFQCDARDMSRFPDAHFDIVLFSFNGIDCVSYADRMEVLNEIARVLKSGGYFIFSAHNTRNLYRKYKFRMPRNPFNLLNEFLRMRKIRQLNGKIEQYKGKEYFEFYDGAENFSMRIVYIQPELQIELMLKTGFEHPKLINIKTGEYMSVDKLPEYTEPWTYFTSIKK
jgi:ubiquinone/menaquinone biosynthesis C-methylase UbiE